MRKHVHFGLKRAVYFVKYGFDKGKIDSRQRDRQTDRQTQSDRHSQADRQRQTDRQFLLKSPNIITMS